MEFLTGQISVVLLEHLFVDQAVFSVDANPQGAEQITRGEVVANPERDNVCANRSCAASLALRT